MIATKRHRQVATRLNVATVAALFVLSIAFSATVGCDGSTNSTDATQHASTSDSPAQKIATPVLLALVHVLIVGTVFLMIGVAISVISKESNDFERIILGASLATGFLIYVAARALGISIPSVMARSIATANPFGIAAMGLVFPSICGTAVAWFCLRMMKKDEDIAKRVALLLTTLIITMFSDVYIALAPDMGLTNGKYALPNVTFVLGVTIYTIFTYRRPKR